MSWISPTRDKNFTTVKLSELPTDTSRLCQLFRIKSASIFTGGKDHCHTYGLLLCADHILFVIEFLEKKFGGEFLFKKRFIWCDPSTRSILWYRKVQLITVCYRYNNKFPVFMLLFRAKSSEIRQKNPSACKFVLLKRFLSRKSIVAGQCRGIVHHISFNEQGFNILTESGTHMTVKVSYIYFHHYS